jgi:hypothetical protein
MDGFIACAALCLASAASVDSCPHAATYGANTGITTRFLRPLEPDGWPLRWSVGHDARQHRVCVVASPGPRPDTLRGSGRSWSLKIGFAQLKSEAICSDFTFPIIPI